MPIPIRRRMNVRSFELRIKHKLLPKPVYSTWASEADARKFGMRAENFLDRGIVPDTMVFHFALAVADLIILKCLVA